MMDRETLNDNRNQPESWAATIAGALFYLLAGLEMMSGDIPRAWVIPSWLEGVDFLYLFGLLVPAIAFAVGWVLYFPRWSYPYTAALLVFSLYMMSTATPLLRQLGYLNRGWGYLAWAPFLMAVLVGLLLTRSLRPIAKFFANIRRDWTLGTYAMLAWMPMVIAIGFDEIDRQYSLVFKILLTILMVTTSLLYMRTGRQEARSRILVVGVLLCLAVTEIGTIAYWQPVGGVFIPGAIAWGLVILGIMLSPAVIFRQGRPTGERSAQA
jgi:hypothetical protein